MITQDWCVFNDTYYEALRKFKELKKSLGNHWEGLWRVQTMIEVVNMSSKDFNNDNGLRHLNTLPHTPKQNGIVKRKNTTLK